MSASTKHSQPMRGDKCKSLDTLYRRNWVPVNGTSETPFQCRDGRMLLYVWDTFSGDHAYLDVETDVVLENAEALVLVGGY